MISKNTFTRAQWKNGLGYTDQIAIEPAGSDLRAGNYLWRMSSASIANASEFSIFPDHDRALVILEGAGVRLFHTDEGFEDSVDLPPLEPYEFPGDIKSRCELLDGPIRDLSIFFRKGVVSASVDVIRIEADTVWNWENRAAWNFIFGVRGDFEVCTSEEVTETLASGDAFRVDGTESGEASYPVVPHGAGSILVSLSLWR